MSGHGWLHPLTVVPSLSGEVKGAGIQAGGGDWKEQTGTESLGSRELIACQIRVSRHLQPHRQERELEWCFITRKCLSATDQDLRCIHHPSYFVLDRINIVLLTEFKTFQWLKRCSCTFSHHGKAKYQLASFDQIGEKYKTLKTQLEVFQIKCNACDLGSAKLIRTDMTPALS